MRKIKNQRGFSTLEIILVVGVIAMLSTVSVPNIIRVLDRVFLDYETKTLYSELNFARSIGKSSAFQSSVFALEDSNNTVEFWLYSKYYPVNDAQNRHIIKRTTLTQENFYVHNLNPDTNLEFDNGTKVLKISFDNPSRYSSGSRTVTLTSKFNHQYKIIFDSVGRWRCEYVK